MALCTSAQVKLRLGIATGDTDNDLALAQIVLGVSEALKGPAGAGRELELPAGLSTVKRTRLLDVLDRGTEILLLPVWPVSLVDSVKEALYHACSDAEKLIEDEEFQTDYERGRLIRIGGCWLRGPQTVQVILRDGYVAAGVTPGTGETAMPDDIVEAAIQQCAFVFQRRLTLGTSGQSAQGGSVSHAAADELLPGVREIMARYRRLGV